MHRTANTGSRSLIANEWLEQSFLSRVYSTSNLPAYMQHLLTGSSAAQMLEQLTSQSTFAQDSGFEKTLIYVKHQYYSLPQPMGTRGSTPLVAQ